MRDNVGTSAADRTIGPAVIAALLSFTATALVAFVVTPELAAVLLAPAVLAALCVAAFGSPGTRAYAVGAGAASGGALPVGVWVATHMGQDATTVRILFGWAFNAAIYLVAAAAVSTVAAWGGSRAAQTPRPDRR